MTHGSSTSKLGWKLIDGILQAMFYPCKPLYPPPWLQMDARHLKPMRIFSLARMSSTFDLGPFHLGHLWLPNTIRKWMCHRVLWYLRCCFSLASATLWKGRKETSSDILQPSIKITVLRGSLETGMDADAMQRQGDCGSLQLPFRPCPWSNFPTSYDIRDIWHHASRFQRWIASCNVPNICRNLMKLTSCQNYSATDKSDKSSKIKMRPLPDLSPSLPATPQGLSKAWWPKTNWNRSNDSPLPETTQKILRSKIKNRVSSWAMKILDLNVFLRSSCLLEFLWVGQMDGFNWFNWWAMMAEKR